MGLFEVARRFAEIIAKPAAHLAQSIYPELAKLSSRGESKALRKLVVRAGALAGAGGLASFAVIAAVGQFLIRWTVGEEFADAYVLLVPMALASSIWFGTFAFGPVLFATGRAHWLMHFALVIGIFYLALLAVLIWQVGLIGAGIAAVASTLLGLLVLSVLAWRAVERAMPESSQ